MTYSSPPYLVVVSKLDTKMRGIGLVAVDRQLMLSLNCTPDAGTKMEKGYSRIVAEMVVFHKAIQFRESKLNARLSFFAGFRTDSAAYRPPMRDE